MIALLPEVLLRYLVTYMTRTEDMLLAGLQYVGMYVYHVLPRIITKECINVKLGLLLVWGEERTGLRDDVLRTLTAWSGSDTVEYDSSAMGNLFMVTRKWLKAVLLASKSSYFQLWLE